MAARWKAAFGGIAGRECMVFAVRRARRGVARAYLAEVLADAAAWRKRLADRRATMHPLAAARPVHVANFARSIRFGRSELQRLRDARLSFIDCGEWRALP